MSSTASPVKSGASEPATSQRPNLDYLDGIRGLAALYVVLFHLHIQYLTGLSRTLTAWAGFGHYAVAVFIVLSGYLLMIPLVRSVDGQFRGGVMEFFRRRARRILPPYYAALLLAFPIDFIHRKMLIHAHKLGAHELIDKGGILTHLLLIHNWFPKWSQSIDVPMWSVAVEWQIYFLFPLILIPAWRKFGPWGMLAAGMVVGYLPLLVQPFLNHTPVNVASAGPWYFGLFAMGAVGATLNFSKDANLAARLRKVPWLIIGGIICAAALTVDAVVGTGPLIEVILDPFIGIAAFCLIVGLTNRMQTSRSEQGPAFKFLRSRPLLALGAFSYSLYLVHSPIEWSLTWLFKKVIHSLSSSPVELQLVQWLIELPIILVCAYLFHLAFEKRFMNHVPHKSSL